MRDEKRSAGGAPPVIGPETLRQATEILLRYKAGKANFERRVIEDEEFWKLRHWDHIPEQGTTGLKTKSAWLVNVILSKHADAMDAYPEPACLPRAADDEAEARLLSKVVPAVLAQNDFEKTWSDNWWKKLKAGVAIYGVFWDRARLGGRGDVAIERIDPLNLFWEPGISDLQQSRNLFHVELRDNDALVEAYPVLEGKLHPGAFRTSRYLYDDTVDVSGKSPVIDWYYKKRVGGRTVLHYVKYVGETVLFATENETGAADGGSGPAAGPVPLAVRGLYDHGMYPFFADVLFPEEGTPAGFGYVDLCKDAQRQIDLMNNAIVANCVAAATPRWLKRGDDGINEAEYADWTRPFVHVQGSIEDSALRQITVAPLSGNYLNILASKINEIKETSGNRDVNNGGVAGGVTAASAIAAMQEQSGKLSRDQIQSAYRCFRQVVLCVIALIRQFYDGPRQLRVTGAPGEVAYLRFDGTKELSQTPVSLDIEVTAQRENPYNRMSYNEMALQFFRLGFFNPELTDQALAALEMMDFKGKEAMRRRIQQNGTLRDRLLEARQQLVSLRDLIAPSGTVFAGDGSPDGPAFAEEDGPDASAFAERGSPDGTAFAGRGSPDGSAFAEKSGPDRKKAPAGRSPRKPAAAEQELRPRTTDVLGYEKKRNAIAEKARARAAAATQPR